MMQNLKSSQRCQALLKSASEIFIGKEKVLSWAICCFLTRGHLLLEDFPGVGKTTLVYMLSRLFGLDVSRIQFTNDLLPSDITGTLIFNQKDGEFVFKQGPLFGQVILADELNRATPKTQSALLQAMEERFISVDGKEYKLGDDFLVLATQNPIHQIGTFPLPESQLDRFFMSASLDFPDFEFEKIMIQNGDIRSDIKNMPAHFKREELPALRTDVANVQYTDAILNYILSILRKGRVELDNGHTLSPRCGRDLLTAAQAYSLLQGREYTLPEDVQAVAPAVIGHRLGGPRGIKVGHDEVVGLLKNVPVV